MIWSFSVFEVCFKLSTKSLVYEMANSFYTLILKHKSRPRNNQSGTQQ